MKIYGEDDNLYIEDCNITINCTGFNGNKNMNATNGLAVFNGYFNDACINETINASIEGQNFSDSKKVNITEANFVAVFERISPIPSLSKDFFNCSIKIVDNSTQERMMGKEGSLNLYLIPENSTMCSGSKIEGNIIEVKTDNGIANFLNLKILSSGNFKLAANYSNVTTGYSRILAITNFIIYTNSINTEEPYVYDRYNHQIDDNNTYLRYINSSIISSSGILSGSYFNTTGHHVICYSYITSMKNYKINLKIEDFESFIIEHNIVPIPNPNALLVVKYRNYYREYPFPSLSTDTFGGFEEKEYICVQLKSSNTDNVFEYHKYFSNLLTANIICASNSCSGEKLEYEYFEFYRWIYNDRVFKDNSMKCFKIKILSNGHFKLKFSLPGVKDGFLQENGTEKLFKITNFVKLITFQSIYMNPEVNYDFQVMFLVYGDDDELYSKKNYLSISSECLSKEIKVLCEKGIVITILNFTKGGNCSIEVKSTHQPKMSWIFNITILGDNKTVKYINFSSMVNSAYPINSSDSFDIYLTTKSNYSASSLPFPKVMANGRPFSSIINCNSTQKNESFIIYSSCKILSSGNFSIFFERLAFDETIFKISNNILSVFNKSQIFLNELFEIRAIILEENNFIFHDFMSIEISNNEIVGQKYSRYANNEIIFLVSCIEKNPFNLTFIIKYHSGNTLTLSSNETNCEPAKENLINLSIMQNMVPVNKSLSTFNVRVDFNSSNILAYINQIVQLKIFEIIENKIAILEDKVLKTSSLDFNNINIENPGKYIIFASLKNNLNLSSFIYSEVLIIKSLISNVTIIVPEFISNITNSTIEVRLLRSNNDLCSDESFKVTLSVNNSTNYTSQIFKGVALFFINFQYQLTTHLPQQLKIQISLVH